MKAETKFLSPQNEEVGPSKITKDYMDPGRYGAPLGFPNHIEFQFCTMQIDHFRQYIIACFGVGFLQEVESLPYPLVLPVIMYAHRWVISFYVLF